MEKLSVEVNQEKVKEAEKSKKPPLGGVGGVGPSRLPKTDPEEEKNVPWDPEKGTEPFEKRPDSSK